MTSKRSLIEQDPTFAEHAIYRCLSAYADEGLIEHRDVLAKLGELHRAWMTAPRGGLRNFVDFAMTEHHVTGITREIEDAWTSAIAKAA